MVDGRAGHMFFVFVCIVAWYNVAMLYNQLRRTAADREDCAAAPMALTRPPPICAAATGPTQVYTVYTIYCGLRDDDDNNNRNVYIRCAATFGIYT